MFICPLTDNPEAEIMVIPMRPDRLFSNTTEIKDAVAEAFGVSVSALVSDRRTMDLAKPRFAAYAIYRDHTKFSLPRIARIFNRDHTTVMHGLKRVEELLAEDGYFKQCYSRSLDLIESNILESETTKPEIRKYKDRGFSKPKGKTSTKKRKCLRCENTFDSKGHGNRLCTCCRTSHLNREFEGVSV
jgi:hypothetical protein